MPLPVDFGVLHPRQSSDELGGVDVHQNVRILSLVVAVAIRHRDAWPFCSARWESTHWIARREHHGEGEQDERVEDKHEHATRKRFGDLSW